MESHSFTKVYMGLVGFVLVSIGPQTMCYFKLFEELHEQFIESNLLIPII